MREDPYYITDGRPTRVVDDINSIPVVRLDDLPPPLPREEPRLLHFAMIPPDQYQSHSISSWRRKARCRKASFQSRLVKSLRRPSDIQRQYDVPDEDTQASTPEPIKVTRAKKKGPSSTKKKQRVNPDG
ncbi:hypothetical protein L210DRAFT_3556243 [Boletus edulis BED1]|uniref:Uncharacterized protein n=1 Tax=Boletus edulis BED1 TaxID=1328754 RepID=A0AAD4BL21_BOLED|nr:hypothetical protein L210DRAFT_3556243 [Boletus edulis BED1]